MKTYPSSFGIATIMELLPHRPPFLLLDKILDWRAEKSITALKNVTMNEPFFQGHFPGHPIFPGVLLIEASAQAAGILYLLSFADSVSKDTLVYFMTVDKVKFRIPVVPGDTVIFDISLLSRRGLYSKMHCKGTVEGKVVFEGIVAAMMMNNAHDDMVLS